VKHTATVGGRFRNDEAINGGSRFCPCSSLAVRSFLMSQKNAAGEKPVRGDRAGKFVGWLSLKINHEIHEPKKIYFTRISR